MNSSILIFILGIFFIFSCTENTQTELTQEQKQAIIEEVNAQWEISVEGIEQRDAYKGFSVFTKDAKFIKEGYLYTHIDTAINQWARGFSRSSGPIRKITCDPLYFDVLNENTVVTSTNIMPISKRFDIN